MAVGRRGGRPDGNVGKLRISGGLWRWHCGSGSAAPRRGLKELYEALRDLDVKDFAYLLRFRLYEEGETIRRLPGGVPGRVAPGSCRQTRCSGNTEEFSRLNDEKLTEAFEGAHRVSITADR